MGDVALGKSGMGSSVHPLSPRRLRSTELGCGRVGATGIVTVILLFRRLPCSPRPSAQVYSAQATFGQTRRGESSPLSVKHICLPYIKRVLA